MDLFAKLESMAVNAADNCDVELSQLRRILGYGKHYLHILTPRPSSSSKTRRAIISVGEYRMIIGTWSGHRKRLKAFLGRRTSTGSREAASWHSFTAKRNRRRLQRLKRSLLFWSCSKEYWVTRKGFKLLPICWNHLTPFKQLRRLETPFFVASMAIASNPSKTGFYKKIPHSNPHSFDYPKPRKTLQQPRFIRPSAWGRLCHNIDCPRV